MEPLPSTTSAASTGSRSAAEPPRHAAGLETFRLALQSAARALACEPRLQVDFSGPRASRGTHVLHLPAQSRVPDAALAAGLRGTVDLFALRHRHHDPVLHGRLRPKQQVAGALFDRWEDVRVEVVGTHGLPGASRNIGALLRSRLRSQDAEQPGSDRPAVEGLAWDLRAALLLRRAPAAVVERVGRSGSVLREEDIERLHRDLACQHAFAHTALTWLHQAGFIDGDAGLRSAMEVELDCEGRPIGSHPPDRVREEPLLEVAPVPPGSVGAGAAERAGASGSAGDSAGGAEAGAGAPGVASPQPAGYRVFDRSHDEVVSAAALGDADRNAQLRRSLDSESAQLRARMGPRLRRLQRCMGAAQPLRWQSSLEQGSLDPARLAGVVANPLNLCVHRQRTRPGPAGVAVTLLVDNSGSMRGAPIAYAAAAVDVLAPLLERGGVRLEILGFTTGAWMGGRPCERWVGAGSPPLPGRLNQLRHIVYKHLDQPWAVARRSLGAMLDGRNLKENIDGEALAWAHARLLARTHRRRILVMLCDGSPSDTATEQANGSGYLHRHLQEVIGRIGALQAVELLTIGTDPAVSGLYPGAVVLAGPEAWGRALADALAERLSMPDYGRR